MAGRGRGVLVTGGNSGIGLETARRFLEDGDRVVITGRSGPQGREALRGLGAVGKSVEFIPADLSRPGQVRPMVEGALDYLGGLDVLVNNAGIWRLGTIDDLGEEVWRETLEVNLTAAFLVSKYALDALARSRGAIVNNASTDGLIAEPRGAAYIASKFGLVGLTRSMALDLAPRGIRVNCVCPGDVETPMMATYFEAQPDPAGARAAETSLYPLGRLGKPRDVAEAIHFLASPAAAWITGVALPVDGGHLAGWPPPGLLSPSTPAFGTEPGPGPGPRRRTRP